MSVINQMLRDLESSARSTQTLNMQAVAATPRTSGGKILTLIVLVSVLGLAGYYGVTTYLNQQPDAALVGEPILTDSQTSNNSPQTSSQPTDDQSQPLAHNTSFSGTITQPQEQQPTTEQPVTHHSADILVATGQVSGHQPSQSEVTQTASDQPSSSSVNLPTDSNDPVAEAVISATQKSDKLEKPTSGSSKQTSRVSAATSKSDAPAPKTASTHERIQPSSQTRLSKELQQIQSALATNGYQQTRAALDDLLAVANDFHTARLYGLQLGEQYQDPQLTQMLADAVKQFPQISAYRLAAARYFFQQGKYQQTEDYLLDIRPELSHYFDLLQIRGLTRQQINKHQLAILDYSTILKNEPNRGDIYLAMGISFEALGDFNQARRSFQNALSDRRLTIRQQAFAESKINQYQG